MVLAHENVTQQKLIQEALRVKQAELQAIHDASPLGIFLTDVEGRCLYTNLNYLRLSGLSGEAVIGSGWTEAIHPDDRERVVTAWDEAARHNRTFESMHRYYHLDGQVCWANLKAAAIRTGATITGFVCTVEDITARKQVEDALAQSAVELQARNEELDTFAHTVAHNLQGPLARLVACVDLVRENYATLSAEEIESYFQLISDTEYKMKNIIHELLLLAGVRKQEVSPEPLLMANIVAEVGQRLGHLITEYQAEIIFPPSWPIALGYPPWVEEVWVNYLSNGLKYGGRPPRLELGATVQSDGMVRFWVRDNGPGLTQAQQALLFTPFTQLSQVRTQGYGLGLSIVRWIVEKLGGQVGVESEGVPGGGSTFFFTLPGAV